MRERRQINERRIRDEREQILPKKNEGATVTLLFQRVIVVF